MDEVSYVEKIGPNGREMIPVPVNTEVPPETEIAEEPKKRTRKKKTAE